MLLSYFYLSLVKFTSLSIVNLPHCMIIIHFFINQLSACFFLQNRYSTIHFL